jgi:uncharacterized protein YraI
VDGEVGEDTCAALESALAKLDKPVSNPRKVRIVGGKCYVRAEPSASGKKLGVAHEGEVYNYAGESTGTDWNRIEYNGGTGWVSGKYSRLAKQ